jgi:chromosome segregation protein
MQGFKSFADRTKIEFDSEVTAIVGPNGCGKSNVADAIRWVLGEQSAKTLRGKSMQDVIFNGTENRKSTSYCEVSLFFDNKSKLFNIDYDELVLTRKLDRSGESEYLINKNTCRLKDIIDLLRDTGAGREGYSIIGQGRIDEILSAKPDDRRNIFEEAAGIAKSKSKKIESERKLIRTRENLGRHEDIMGELFRQLEPLKRQSEDARKCQELKDELKTNEVNAYIYQYENNAKEKDIINRRLLDVETRLEAERAAYNGIIASFNAGMNSISNTDTHIASLREELTELLVEAEKNAGELKLRNERINNLKAEENRLNGETQSLRAAIAFKKAALKDCGEQAGELTRRIYDKENLLAHAAAELAKLKESLNEREGKIELSNRNIIDNMGKLSDIKANMSQLLKEEELLKQNREAFLSKAEEIEAAVLSAEQSKNQIEAEASRIKLLIDGGAAELARLEAEYAARQIKISRGQEESKTLSGRIAALETKAKMLEDIKNEYEGFSYPVKKLMTDSKTDKNLKDRNLGVLADVIKVEEKYEQAIDVALGAALQNVIVNDEDDAKYLIAYLKERRYGRVTFLPMSGVKQRLLEREYDEIIKIPGCFGAASELIGYDKRFQGIVRNLLGRTVVVDVIDTAIAMARKYNYAFRIVTLDGEVFMPSGAITGGSRKTDSNADIISRDRNIAQVKESLKAAVGQYAMLDGAVKAAQDGIGKIKSGIEAKSKEQKNNEIAYAALTERAEKADAQLKTLERERSILQSGLLSVNQRMEEIRTDIGSVDKLETDIMARRKSIDELREESRTQFNQKRTERETLEESITKAKITLSQMNKDSDTAAERSAVLQEEMTAAAERIAGLESVIVKIRTALREQEAKTVAEAMSAEQREKIDGLKSRLAGLGEYKAECQRELNALDEKRNAASDVITALNEKKIREENALERLDTDVTMLEERVREEYGLEYGDALAFRQEEYDYQKSLTFINRLKRKISELGNVNMLAVKEYAEVSGRYGEMAAQRDDMQKAESDLLKIINDLTSEMNIKFKTEFDKINENFMSIFKQLFNGGKAKLQIEEAEDKDLLNAGIEIYAEPPGKRLQHISLLSGGEKALTAIAILFAILKLKPMPFCVLDEIEAALDDANANLFAEYLRKFSKNTQFIVITHRKPTMELADTLYGVTMEEKGVSRLVSVQLSEAVKNVKAG